MICGSKSYFFLDFVITAWITKTMNPIRTPKQIATTADTINGNWN